MVMEMAWRSTKGRWLTHPIERLERHWRTRSHCVPLLGNDEARAQFKRRVEARHKEKEGLKMRERKVVSKTDGESRRSSSASAEESDD